MKKLLLIPLLLLISCSEQKNNDNQDMLDYVDLCVYTQFHIDYQDRELIVSKTYEIEDYYLTDIYYRIEYINNVYETKYISAVNDNNELVIKEVLR